MGITQKALAAGVPVCAVPFGRDQFEVARRVSKGEADRGLLICGTGIGMCIAANKVKGVRAASCHDTISTGKLRVSSPLTRALPTPVALK